MLLQGLFAPFGPKLATKAPEFIAGFLISFPSTNCLFEKQLQGKILTS